MSDKKISMVICDEDVAPAPIIRKASERVQRGENINFHWDDTPVEMVGHMYKLNWYSKYYLNDKHGNDYNHTFDITQQNFCKGTKDKICSVPVTDALTHVIDGSYIIFKLLSVNRCMKKGTFTNFVVYEKRACNETDRNPQLGTPCYELNMVDVNVPLSYRPMSATLNMAEGGDSGNSSGASLADDIATTDVSIVDGDMIVTKTLVEKVISIVKPIGGDKAVNPFGDVTDSELFD